MKVYTIRDVAEKAGVSVTTVSRVLNHRPDVKEDTRRHVERVMAECNFVGNANARSLKQHPIEVVAVILRGLKSVFLAQLAEEILHHAGMGDLPYITEYIDERADEFKTALHLARERRVAGFIFVGSRIDERITSLHTLDVPMVFATVSTAGTPLRRASSVTIDDRAMSRRAVTELLRMGHRRIAVFGGPSVGGDSPYLRRQGVQDAFEAAGLRFAEEDFVPTRFSMEDARREATAYFAAHPEATAAFCMSDTMAIGVMRALHDLGRRVPQDVSVMGVDGTELGSYTVPSLSTVVQPVDKIASESVRVLRSMLQGGGPEHVLVDASLALRESTAALP